MSNEIQNSESSRNIEFEGMDNSVDTLRKLLSKPAGHSDIVITISVEICGKEKTENKTGACGKKCPVCGSDELMLISPKSHSYYCPQCNTNIHNLIERMDPHCGCRGDE